MIDTLRADHVGAYGHDRPTTPNIDSLAATGVVFEQASAAAPWTLPSVVSMMTSTFPCEHGVRVDGERLRTEIVPLAEHLRRAGYGTASIIANGFAGKSAGLDRGFDAPMVLPSIGGETIRRWFRPSADRPFFLYLHDIRPHDPYQAPVEPLGEPLAIETSRRRLANKRLQAYRRLTRIDFDAGRKPGETDNRAKQESAMGWLADRRRMIETLYDAEIRSADAVVGDVITELERLGRWQNTLFVLTSDHGEEFDDHGGWQHDQSLYEELIRVPLIVRLPDDELAGLRVSRPVSLVGLIPTIADRLHRPAMKATSRGTSWLPTVPAGQRYDAADAMPIVAERDNRKKFYAPHHSKRGNRNVAVRQGKWKAIWNAEPDTVELYDLASDAREQRDRSADEPARARAMKQAAQEWLAGCSAPEHPVPTGPIDEAEKQQLRALGYVD